MKLNFSRMPTDYPVKVRKPSGYWLFMIDVKSRLGPAGKTVAEDEWPRLPLEIKEQYKGHAGEMKKNGEQLFWTNALRLEGIIEEKNCFQKAYEMLKGERDSSDEEVSIDDINDYLCHGEHML